LVKVSSVSVERKWKVAAGDLAAPAVYFACIDAALPVHGFMAMHYPDYTIGTGTSERAARDMLYSNYL